MRAPRPTAQDAAVGARLRRALRNYPPMGRYLAAVSGGRDSVALLHILREAGYKRLIVCHLDHQLRPESTGDAEFVENLARRWNYPAVVETVDVAALARATKTSLETAARDARRAFFSRVSRRRRCRRLFLAHHADDQVETFLFRLLRGAGPAGLGAMRAESTLSAETPVRLLRPLLGLWRAEIDRYVQAHGLPFREDNSNADPAHTRNRVRNVVLPMLDRELGRSVRPALWRAADLLGAEEAWLADLMQAEPPPASQISVHELSARPLALQRRVIRRWLETEAAPSADFEAVESILSLLDAAGGPAKVNLAGGWHARRRGGVLFLQPAPG